MNFHIHDVLQLGLHPERAFDDAFVMVSKAGADKGNLVVVCHPQDQIVPFASSLYVGLGLHENTKSSQPETQTSRLKSMVLDTPHPNAHMVPLDHAPTAWFQFLELASRLLNR